MIFQSAIVDIGSRWWFYGIWRIHVDILAILFLALVGEGLTKMKCQNMLKNVINILTEKYGAIAN